MPPLVSVVLPVRNAAPTLARALDSIRAQTLADWELLVVDDGSTDGSAAIAQQAAAVDPRVRVLAAPARGLVPALNAGLAAARGAFVARMDADDCSWPTRLARQVALLQTHPEVGVASCLVEFGGDRAASAGYALHVDWVNALREPDGIAVHRFVEAPVAHPSVMFRRDLVGRLGGYRDGDFPEDYELWLRWLDAGVRFAKVPEVLLTWQDGPARLSRTDPRYDPDAFFRVKAEYLARELRRGGRDTVWIWGAGRPTRKRAAVLGEYGLTIAGYIDVDVKKSGRQFGSVPVIAPADLPPPGERFVLSYVSSRGARDLIRAELERRGYRVGHDYLLCA